MANSRGIEVHGRSEKYKNFLGIDSVTYSFVDKLGQRQSTASREVMTRPDAAAILMVDEKRRLAVVTRQVRIATWTESNPDDAWVLEIPAGVVEAKHSVETWRAETPAECAQREALEETRYRPSNCTRIATILPSPGGTSERIHIFYAAIDVEDPSPRFVQNGDEYIEVEHMPLDKLSEFIATARQVDAKLMVAAQWLKTRAALSTELDPGEFCYAFTEDLKRRQHRPRIIGYQTGGIDDVRGIDVWVNAENTDMQMARFFEASISGRIRSLGAAKTPDHAVFSDTINDDLRRQLRGQVAVPPGSVIVTTPGDLRYTHDVKHIFHVACAQHSSFGKTTADIGAVAVGFQRTLDRARTMNRNLLRITRVVLSPVESMLVPLIGTGNGGAREVDVAARMIRIALEDHHQHDHGAFLNPLRKIFFIARMAKQREVFEELLQPFVRGGQLREWPEGGVRRKQRFGAPQSHPGSSSSGPAISEQPVGQPAPSS